MSAKAKKAAYNKEYRNRPGVLSNGIALGEVTAAGVPDLAGYAKVGHGHTATTTVTTTVE